MQSHLRAVNRLITRNSTNGKCQKQQPDERERERELGRETHGTRVSPAPRDTRTRTFFLFYYHKSHAVFL